LTDADRSSIALDVADHFGGAADRGRRVQRCHAILAAINATAVGRDGALWFPEPPDKIGRITTTGAITLHRVPGQNNMPWD
jgi:hypothetical protein